MSKLLLKTNKIGFLFSKVIRKLKFPIKVNTFFNDFRHKIVLKYIYKDYENIIKKYAGFKDEKYSLKKTNKKIIWIFWWQGISNAPVIVKMCIKSVIDNNKAATIIIIDKNNIKKYADLPNYIYEKVASGIISLTQLSDILRWNLLSNYGGLWMDSTLYNIRALPDYCFDNFFTAGPFSNDKEHFNISCGKWTGFFIGGNSDNVFFEYMNEMFLVYWKHSKYLVDYFLIDYFIYIAYQKNIGNLRCLLRYRKENNICLFDLEKKINRVYDRNFFKSNKNTFVYKLSYKVKFKKGNTFFHELEGNFLDGK
ncbi:polysaccharide biosynthesis protein [Lactiplantibacillus plantarum]|nr:polysaccharide biosynthesis protein [Lactiplantibacillus plantarum]MCG0644315.1 polysaccharide biosynthesis protein [Lactiplantibacillus plantarum]MCG0647431.1 polysaccharide biosynthesis protein [Lactiplantibacillus plantarum]MCG0653605.1 polysaccharide biosynthesis protein [Lactiplantibacillus plantarum]MCG0786516.1 polysaccharide biosynthesis protein [Lactiplantibacillus plantarum]